MENLKKFFPLAFVKKDSVAALVINILIQLGINVVLGIIIGIIIKIPVIGAIISLVSGVVGLYFFVSIVLSVLDYLKVLK